MKLTINHLITTKDGDGMISIEVSTDLIGHSVLSQIPLQEIAASLNRVIQELINGIDANKIPFTWSANTDIRLFGGIE